MEELGFFLREANEDELDIFFDLLNGFVNRNLENNNRAKVMNYLTYDGELDLEEEAKAKSQECGGYDIEDAKGHVIEELFMNRLLGN